MSDNTLTELMDEFGVHVEMSDGEDDTVSQVLMDMLTEIHRLRNQAAERATPMPSDEELVEILQEARSLHHFGELKGFYEPRSDDWMEGMLKGIRAVREAIAAAQPLTVPEIPKGWNLVAVEWVAAEGNYLASLNRLDSPASLAFGDASTWQEALAAAIAATGEGE